MPDLDKVERNLRPEWQRAYRMIKGRHPIEEVVRVVLSCLAESVRRRGGAPRLLEVAELVDRYDRGLLDDRSFVTTLDRLERKMMSTSERTVARAALCPSVSGPASFLLGRPDERVSREYLTRLVEHDLFYPQRVYLLGRRFSTREEEVRFETDLLSRLRPGIDQLVQQLVRDPAGSHLRAPRGPRRRTTDELLNQPL